MLKKLRKLLKHVVLAFLILYGLNYLISSIHIYIPINYITVGIASLIIMFFIVK